MRNPRRTRFFASVGLGFAALIGLANGCDFASCRAEWGRSGLPVRWGPMSGCQVSPRPGLWIPAKAYAYRETP